jgi:hypothetical protein
MPRLLPAYPVFQKNTDPAYGEDSNSAKRRVKGERTEADIRMPVNTSHVHCNEKERNHEAYHDKQKSPPSQKDQYGLQHMLMYLEMVSATSRKGGWRLKSGCEVIGFSPY